MSRKVILDVDPGVTDALAMCLALTSQDLEVLAITATGGNVPPEQATRNVQAIVEHLDPPRLPRIGMADQTQALRTDNRYFYGSDGLCGANLRVAELHNLHSAQKVITDEIRSSPGEVTIITGGPLSNLAAVLRVEPDLATRIGHVIIVGGTLNGPGNITAAAEFNMYCDAESAHFVFHAPLTMTMLPWDITSQVVLRYDLLDHLPDNSSNLGRVLQAILPGGFRASRQHLGLEGIHVPEAIAVIVATQPELIETERMPCDVETMGRITHGATVTDRRLVTPEQPNIDVAVEIDTEDVIDAIIRGLQSKE